MEWQLSGGETKGEPSGESTMQPEAKESTSSFEDVAVDLAEESDMGEDGTELMEKKRTDEAGPQTVAEKS